MTEKTARFLPFNAINEFMNADYRLDVIRETISQINTLPNELRAPVDKLTRELVHVSGFRNSVKAPTPLKVRPLVDAFIKHPALVAALLAAWAEIHGDLRQQIYDLLVERGWEVLPPEADRTKIPGFVPHWPKGQDFDTLNAAFAEKYPGQEVNPDDISLMIVWVSTRLPYPEEEREEAG